VPSSLSHASNLFKDFSHNSQAAGARQVRIYHLSSCGSVHWEHCVEDCRSHQLMFSELQNGQIHILTPSMMINGHFLHCSPYGIQIYHIPDTCCELPFLDPVLGYLLPIDVVLDVTGKSFLNFPKPHVANSLTPGYMEHCWTWLVCFKFFAC